jgi:uncharacterized protein YjiS (DUF1127 family)
MADITISPTLINSHLATLLPRLAATLRLWRRRGRERQELARFGERDLQDIGLSRSVWYYEINKPFWRA